MADRTLELALRIRILSERLEELERARDGAEGFKEAVAGLRNQILGLAAALVGLDKLKDFVNTGIEVNKELENTKLGIAGIVASQAELVDSQGRVIEGQDAFNAASQISSDLLQKLKVDSLQTTATFGQLKDAFQAAVSPGLAAGLNLDQIRELTKQIALAAGALGLDMSQVAQETQAILSGNIDNNAVLARNLGITNEMVAQWQEQGTLAEELNKRMAGFAQMGDATSNSWAGVTSNLSEAYQTLAGLATAGFYEQIKTKLNEALSGIFNLDTGQLEGELKGVSDLLAEILTDLGGVLGDSIVGIMDGLKSMSGYLEANKGEVEDIRNNFGLVFDQVKEIAGELLTVVQSLINAGTEGKVLSGAFEVIAKTIAAFRDGVDFIVMAFTKLGAVVMSALAAPIEQAGNALSLFGLETGKVLESLAGKMKEQADAASQSAGQMWENFAQGKTHLNALTQEAEKFRTLINIPESSGFGAIRDQIQQLTQGMKAAKQPTTEMRTEAERLKSQVEIMFKSGQLSREEYIIALSKIKTALGETSTATVKHKATAQKHIDELQKSAKKAKDYTSALEEVAEAQLDGIRADRDRATALGATALAQQKSAELARVEAEWAQIIAAAKQAQIAAEQALLQAKMAALAAEGLQTEESKKQYTALALQNAALGMESEALKKSAEAKEIAAKSASLSTEATKENTGATEENVETTEESTKANQKASESSEKLATMVAASANQLMKLSEGTRAMVQARLGQFGAITRSSDLSSEALVKLKNGLESAEYAIRHNATTAGMLTGAWIKNYDAVNNTWKAYYEQAIAAENLTLKLEQMLQTQVMNEDLVREASEAATNSLGLLDKASLDRLQGAIDEAKQKLQELQDEANAARDRLSELNAELAREQGDT
ncbi:hypothetical protein, partial [Candidatus Competibacter denitrificans]|uniref:hypothetical protein n=1 Tax=Candidatus Competibacter denitrificans TaxID=1400862 RepID=UPI000660242D